MPVKDILETFAKRVQQQSKTNLSKSGKKDTGGLYNSISYDLKTSGRSFSLSFNMEDYGPYIDQGVKGAKNSSIAPDSPFKFGTGTGKKGGLTNAIDGWVRRNKIQFRDRKTGRFLNYKQTSFVITRSIYNRGIEPTNFFSKPFENEFKKLPQELVEAFGLEVTDFMKYTLKI